MSTTLYLNPDTPQSHSHPQKRNQQAGGDDDHSSHHHHHHYDRTASAPGGRQHPRASARQRRRGAAGLLDSDDPYDDDDDDDYDNGPEEETQRYRRLTHAEWVRFCRGVGAMRDDSDGDSGGGKSIEEGEMAAVVVSRPTCALWPAKGFRDGLYRDVLMQQTKYAYLYYALSISKWVLLLLQIALGSILTALGSFAGSQGIPITVIAAINTGVAGVLALLHNSGLPERFRSDRNEFKAVEEHVKYVVDTALVRGADGVDDALAECFDRFRAARQSVESNMPAFYTPSSALSSASSRRRRQQQQRGRRGGGERR
ncbi:hypothetical protein SLS62_000096 [Diatrype stigma]|uniref:SMODS and SLOG-associating 2TM effector domain-containing protein n=1 Tax=Diatrype stigma TaxID=117547 RepID=A0AAN9VCQ2_9PEZI